LGSLRNRLTYFLDRHVFEYVPRAADDYATHLPVLIGLARLLSFRHILEFGAGMFSTPAFLDRSIFPSVESVDTFETEGEWAERVRSLFGEDKRLRLHRVEGTMAAAVDQVRVLPDTLIFVDDSDNAEARSATIARVALMELGDSIVVIHDFEVSAYRRAASGFKHQFRFRSVNPNVGVLWNRHALDRHRLAGLSKVIRKGRDRIAPSDRNGWNALMLAEG